MSGRNLPRACVAIGTGVLAAALLAAGPAEQPKPSDGRLDERHAGELLWNELRCGACHADENEGPLARPPAPDLSDVGSRLDREFLLQFVKDPIGTHSQTTMPDVLGGDSEKDQKAYLISEFLSWRRSFRSVVSRGDAELGRELYHSIGCVACHEPFDEPRFGDEPSQPLRSPIESGDLIGLDHIKDK